MLVLGFWGCKYIPGGAVFISCNVFRFILAMGTGIDTGQIHFKNFVQWTTSTMLSKIHTEFDTSKIGINLQMESFKLDEGAMKKC